MQFLFSNKSVENLNNTFQALFLFSNKSFSPRNYHKNMALVFVVNFNYSVIPCKVSKQNENC